MKVAVIGAGWTGCHLTRVLTECGLNVTLFEQSAVFAGSSGANQCRLHLGFHYPRTYGTIRNLISSFDRFTAEYGRFAIPIKKNIYAVANRDSKLDFQTFCSIMRSHGSFFEEVDPDRSGLVNVEGALRCNEMAIDNTGAAAFFAKTLAPQVVFSPGPSLKKNSAYDWVIDATSNVAIPFEPDEFKYELCVMFRYSSDRIKDLAITIMDGEFGSLYPFPGGEGTEYALSGVKETVLETFSTPDEAYRALQNSGRRELGSVRERMTEKMVSFYPSFERSFKYVAPIFALKTKPKHESDSRRWHRVWVEGNVIHAFASKITNIFPIEDDVLKILGIRRSSSERAA